MAVLQNEHILIVSEGLSTGKSMVIFTNIGQLLCTQIQDTRNLPIRVLFLSRPAVIISRIYVCSSQNKIRNVL